MVGTGTINAIPSQLRNGTSSIVLAPNEDDDGDGLLNGWEEVGMDINNDGTIDLGLPSLGANPRHKDIFVEVDYMDLHKPNPTAMTEVEEAFRKAPVSNPDGIDGIKLHIILDEQLPHEDATDATGLFAKKGAHLGNTLERTDVNRENIINSKQQVFHYVLFGHTQPSSTSSGESPNMPGLEFMVTLGASKWGKDPVTDHNVGSKDQQAGTFMHELGHNLGLDHGGWNSINCKPNYLSVMNYAFQMPSLIGDRPLDYSRSVLNSLNENRLNEKVGIIDSIPPSLRTAYGPEPIQTPQVGHPINWDQDTIPEEPSVRVDINNISTEGCRTSPGDTLAGYNDWQHLDYEVPLSYATSGTNYTSGSDNKTSTPHKDITIDEIIHHRILLWNSIKSNAYPIGPQFFNTSDPIDNQKMNIVNGLLNDTRNNITDLLITNNLSKAINELGELREIYKITNNTEVIWSLDNLETVLRKQI
jgi:hypothetical protein